MAVNKLDLLKDTLELARNYFFAGGMVVLGGTIIYAPTSIGDPRSGNLVAGAILIGAFVYMLLAIGYFEWKHWPSGPKSKIEFTVFLARLCLLLSLLEGSLLMVAKHTDWAHNQEVTAKLKAGQSKPMLPLPNVRCVETVTTETGSN